MGLCHDSDRIVSVYDRRGPGFGQSVFSQKPTMKSENLLNFHFVIENKSLPFFSKARNITKTSRTVHSKPCVRFQFLYGILK